MNTEILEIAVEKFEEEKYDQALELLVTAYENNINREWVLDNIYNCYMTGNEEIFRLNFKNQKENNFCVYTYEDCNLDFVPYKEGEYFIFDKKQKQFKGTLVTQNFMTVDGKAFVGENEFSDIVVQFDGDWRKLYSFVKSTEDNRKLYLLPDHVEQAISFWKIPELQQYMKTIKLFANKEEFQRYFHKNTAEYLPRLVYAEKETDIDAIEKIVEAEHNYRLTDEGRNDSRVLLTIGIPSYNRGNLLLKRLENLLSMPFDAEVEFVVSKNGNELYQEEYEEAGHIKDARLSYYGTNETVKALLNWYNTIEKAHGEFVLLVSDEDDINIQALDHYLRLLYINKNLSQIRVKTSRQYAFIEERQCGKRGLDAFNLFFLMQNYLSGLIIKRKTYISLNILKYEVYSENAFYKNYPHEWWCAELSQAGDCLYEPVTLVIEQDGAGQEELNAYEKIGLLKKKDVYDENSGIFSYATYKSRFEQFYGQVEFIQLFMKNNLDGMFIGFKKAIDKLSAMLSMARELHYKPEQFLNVTDQYVRICVDQMDSFSFNQRQQILLMTYIRNNCCVMIENHYILLEQEKN